MEDRSESQVLDDLEKLCTSPGYVQALAFLVFRDCYVKYVEEAHTEDFLQNHDPEKLSRSEFCTLLGLLIRSDIDTTLPSALAIQEFIERTDSLMLELHHAMMPSMKDLPSRLKAGESIEDLFSGGGILREAVFYAGESAYNFQYRDLAVRKYFADTIWLHDKMGFDIGEAVILSKAVSALQLERITQFQDTFPSMDPNDWTMLPAFEFTVEEVATQSSLDESKVQLIIDAFAVPDGERNTQFQALNDFNVINAAPIIRLAGGRFALFNSYALLEAIYESPFYWMYKDDAYRNIAQDNRGKFLEGLSEECLLRVFGRRHVYKNVLIKDGKQHTVGEIDVLVVFGNRAIVLQAKTKRMTLEARRGNDGVIRSDFAKSIQRAYDQAQSCAEQLLTGRYTYSFADGSPIFLQPIAKAYLACVLSDHDPALSFQCGHFLRKTSKSEAVSPPFVLDVFTLDVMTEMLASPLHLLSYVDRRTSYDDRLAAGHELTILSFHIKRNLWLSKEFDRMMLTDDISADLDLAMTVRRDGLVGKATPEGILTHPKGMPYQDLISEIERDPRPELLELGMMLLKMGGYAIDQLNQGIRRMLNEARRDHRWHNFTMGAGDTGIIFHSSYLPLAEATARLFEHVELRKYKMHAPEWFGVGLHPETGGIMFGYNAKGPWVEDPLLEEASKSLSNDVTARFEDGQLIRQKVGRNEVCPCGSGKKFKKCHGKP